MDIQAVLDFLTPENQSRLTWIGSGIVAVSGGIWIVVKFFLTTGGKSESDPTHPQNPTNYTYGNQASVGNVGGDVRITQTIGATISKIAFAVLIVGLFLLGAGVAAAWFLASGAQAAALPYMEVEIGCGTDNSSKEKIFSANAEEAAALDKLLTLGQGYNSDLVYLSVTVEKPCGACECYRFEKFQDADDTSDKPQNTAASVESKNSQPNPIDDEQIPRQSAGHIEMEWAEEFAFDSSTEGNLQVTGMMYEYWAATHSFFFPAAGQIPRNGLYVNNTIRSYVISYSGPFLVEYNYDTGWGYVKFTPISDPDELTKRRLRCSSADISWRAKILDRCGPIPQPLDEQDVLESEDDSDGSQ